MTNNKNSEVLSGFFLDFLKRNAKGHEDDFNFSFFEDSHGLNKFSVECVNEKVFIKGDCVNSLAQGFYYYLKKSLQYKLLMVRKRYTCFTPNPPRHGKNRKNSKAKVQSIF